MTEPRVSVAVMAHPRRRAFVEELVPRLDREPTVVWDEEEDRWDTGSRSMRAYDPNATHHLVVQDDAIVCRNLVAGVERAAVVAGERPFSLYTGRVRPSHRQIAAKLRQAADVGSAWFEMPGPWWGVGVVVPTSWIDDMLEWGDANPVTPNYDLRMCRYFQRVRHVECWYTIPSLVEHRHGTGANPSLIRGRTGQNRRAYNFIGETASALDVDWSTPPAQPPKGGYVVVDRPPRGVFYRCWDCGWQTVTEQRMRVHRDRHLHPVERARRKKERTRGRQKVQ